MDLLCFEKCLGLTIDKVTPRDIKIKNNLHRSILDGTRATFEVLKCLTIGEYPI